MENAILKSIEGGYKEKTICIENPDMDGKDIYTNVGFYALLDPKFWQCLGKQQGWKQVYSKEFPFVEYMYHWHRFVEHRASGKDVDSFFNELLK